MPQNKFSDDGECAKYTIFFMFSLTDLQGTKLIDRFRKIA